MYQGNSVSRSLAVMALAMGSLSAAPITTLFNTGMGAETTVDSHYLLITNPGFPSTDAFVTDSSGFPFSPYLANDRTSKFISPQPSYRTGATDVGGDFTYRTNFDLAGFDFATAQLSLRFAVDNDLQDILLNGVSTGISGSGFSAFSPVFKINAGFQAGVNSLDFVTYNRPQATGNPNALRVEFTGSDASAVPEPGTWILLASGLSAVVLTSRRLRKQ
ncbi:MAG: PEP-CTERM sorting domain-containing protein [Bryobacteraceae bacterium]